MTNNLYMRPGEMRISDARSHLAQVVREADMLGHPTIITQNGRPAAVVIGFDEWRELVAARDAKIWDRIQRRQATATWLDHDVVVREFAAEHGLDGDTPDVA
jgi:prevent-host-death family protein